MVKKWRRPTNEVINLYFIHCKKYDELRHREDDYLRIAVVGRVGNDLVDRLRFLGSPISIWMRDRSPCFWGANELGDISPKIASNPCEDPSSTCPPLSSAAFRISQFSPFLRRRPHLSRLLHLRLIHSVTAVVIFGQRDLR